MFDVNAKSYKMHRLAYSMQGNAQTYTLIYRIEELNVSTQ